jgi:hypothetical protein
MRIQPPYYDPIPTIGQVPLVAGAIVYTQPDANVAPAAKGSALAALLRAVLPSAKPEADHVATTAQRGRRAGLVTSANLNSFRPLRVK